MFFRSESIPRYIGKTSSSDNNITTQYISDSDMTNVHQGENIWYTGCNPVVGNYYSYLKLNNLPPISDNCKFVQAQLYTGMYTGGFFSNGASSFNLVVSEALSDWKSQFGTSASSNMNPVLDCREIDSSYQGSYMYFDITNAAEKWYSGGANNGLVFVPKSANGENMTSAACASAAFSGYQNSST